MKNAIRATEYTSEANAIESMKLNGAVKFIGSTEDCNILAAYDINGDRMGHCCATYNDKFVKVWITRYS
jgi:hypothetical protein